MSSTLSPLAESFVPRVDPPPPVETVDGSSPSEAPTHESTPQPWVRPWEVAVSNLPSRRLIHVAARDIKAGEPIFQRFPGIAWKTDGLDNETRRYLHGNGNVTHEYVENTYPKDSIRDVHSCAPNCAMHFEMKPYALWDTAIRDIAKGEPITKNVVQCIGPKKDRHDALRRERGQHWCECEVCSYGPAEQRASDGRRKQIERLRTLISDKRKRTSVPTLKELLRLLQREGIIEHQSQVAYMAFEVCVQYGDVENAKLWLNKFLELDQVTGACSTKYTRAVELQGDPTRHPKWMRLVKDGKVVLQQAPQ